MKTETRGRKRQDGPRGDPTKSRHAKSYYANWHKNVEKRRALYQYCVENRLCTRCREALPTEWNKKLCEKHYKTVETYVARQKEKKHQSKVTESVEDAIL